MPLDFLERDVPVRLLGLRRGVDYQPGDPFRIVDALRLDTGMMIKLMGELAGHMPRQEVVVNLVRRSLAKTGTEFEYRVSEVRTGEAIVRDALNAKRSEGPRDLKRDLPPGFEPGHAVTGFSLINEDNPTGQYRIFLAKTEPDMREIKIVARIPDGNPLRRMIMALKPDRDARGREQFQGFYLGEPDANPTPILSGTERGADAADVSTRGRPTAEAQATVVGDMSWSTSSRDQALLSDGYEWIRGESVIDPTPPKRERLGELTDASLIRCIFRARRLVTGEEIRVYADVPGANPIRNLLFKLDRVNQSRAVEHHGRVRIPDGTPCARPDAPRTTSPRQAAAPNRDGAVRNAASAMPTLPGLDEAPKPSEGRVRRVRFKGRKLIYPEEMPRIDGSVDYFLILRARDLDTNADVRVKFISDNPDPLAFRELTLEEAYDSSGVYLRQLADERPEKWRDVDLTTIGWKRMRVTGIQTITPEPEQRGEDWEEEWHIFQAKDAKTGGILKIKGDVPGRDPLRKMTLLVRPERWFRNELQYVGELIEPDPEVPVEEMISMIERLEPPGLGGVLIPRIVERFGMESLYVIRYEPELLEKVDGIGPGTIRQIKEADHLDVKTSIITEMSRVGLNLRYFKAIHDTFREGATEVIRNRPYELLKAPNVPFRAVDEVAVLKQNRSETDPERVRAVLSVTVDAMMRAGKSGDWRSELNSKTAGFVRQVRCENPSLFLHRLWKLCLEESGKPDGIVLVDQDHPEPMIYFREVIEAERRIAQDLVRRARSGTDWRPFDPGPLLRRYEAAKGRPLGAEQAEAVSMICRNGVSIMTGGPGVGKTTTLDAAVRALEAVGVNVVQMAPTGIASKRMASATERDASTIHSVTGRLERQTDEDPFIPTDVPTCAIIDETSMVNVQTLDKMLSALPEHVSILFSGDVDQLPSIGPGEILRDLIRSGVFPVTRLRQVFRQKDGSGIIEAARAINRGEFPAEGEDFGLIRISDPDRIADELVRQCELILKAGELNPMNDLMILSPVKKGPAGVVALNGRLQALLNPPSPGKPEMTVSRPAETDTGRRGAAEEKRREDGKAKDHKEILRVGDRVIQTRNALSRGLVNGDIGFITRVSPQTGTIWVDFDGVEMMIDREQLKEIRLAYAMTVHKSQGSEKRMVLLALPPGYDLMMTKPLLYTGVTRASQKVRVIGDERAFRLCLVQDAGSSTEFARNTTLAKHCIAAVEQPDLDVEDKDEDEDEEWEPEPA